MRYAFDLDDTLADTAPVVNKYAKKFDVKFLNGDGKFKKETGYNSDYYYFADALNWSRDNIKDFFKIYYLDILRNTKVKNGVVNFLKYLKKNENEIFIISSRRIKKVGEIEKITQEWLNKNNIVYDKLFINIKKKYELINKYDIDVFVDDSYDICKDVYNLTNARVFMIQNEYNEKIQDNNIVKIKKINEIIL